MSPSLFGSLRLPAYYRPADRTGIMPVYSAVVSASIAKTSKAYLHSSETSSTLSGVLADFLEQPINIDQSLPTRTETGRHLGESVKKGIPGGSLRTDLPNGVDYPRFTRRSPPRSSRPSSRNVSRTPGTRWPSKI